MRDRTLWIGAPLIVTVSAVIAYGLVFWTPWFGRSGVWVTDYGFTEYEYIGTTMQAPNAIKLAKLQPEEFQSLVQGLFDELLKLSEAQLYILSGARDDVCLSPLIDCLGVPGKNVRPFVEKALAHKQTRESVAIAAGGLQNSHFSLVVSIAALLVSLAGFVVALVTYRRNIDV